jgi:hypothetical protein
MNANEPSAERLVMRRDHIMKHISTPRSTFGGMRPRAWIAGLAGGVAIATGAGVIVANAGSPNVTSQSNGVVAIDTRGLQPSYHGTILTTAQMRALHAEGKATASLQNREAACQGVYLLFDTLGQSDSWESDYLARRTKDQVAEPSSDPCHKYADTPDLTSGS